MGVFLFVIGVSEGEGDGMYPFDLLVVRFSCLLFPVPVADIELVSFADEAFLFFGFGSKSSIFGLRRERVRKRVMCYFR